MISGHHIAKFDQLIIVFFFLPLLMKKFSKSILKTTERGLTLF